MRKGSEKPNMENINSAMALKQKDLRRKCVRIADELREISLRLSEEGEMPTAPASRAQQLPHCEWRMPTTITSSRPSSSAFRVPDFSPTRAFQEQLSA